MIYPDISELDDQANELRVLWRKTINYAATFDRKFLELEARFAGGAYGPEWTFSRWLIVKCRLSSRTAYRVIQTLHRAADEDRREQIRQKQAEERRERAILATERRAAQLAWDGWRREEKERITATQLAWDQWRAEEKERVAAEKAAKKEQAAAEKAIERQRKQAEREQQKIEAQRIKEQRERQKAEQTPSSNAIYQARHRAKQLALRKASYTLNDENLEIDSCRAKTGTDREPELSAVVERLIALLEQIPIHRREAILDSISARILKGLPVGGGEGAWPTVNPVPPVAVHPHYTK